MLPRISDKESNMEGVPIPEIDPHFEPQQRSRANTWPVRPKEFDADSEGARTPNSIHSENDKQEQEPKVEHGEGKDLNLSQKKGGSRRNAWGNLSYADLITKAIQSSPEGRLTLSQIYDWMVQSVPYFRDKGDSNSSAGWKNSIRHNLSLHSRFMRVQNEGTGKSSWWVLNPEAKPGKSPRRRATSMDTKEYVKKRGRVKRKVDQLRAAMEGAAMDNGNNFGSAHELNSMGDPFALSPQDYRQRASSNASSIGGRLSPINAYNDFDEIPGGLSPVSWNQNPMDEGFSDISQGLAGMLMADNGTLQDNMVTSTGLMGPQSTSPLSQQLSPNGYDHTPTYLQVGGYPDQNNMRQLSPQQLSPSPCNPRASPTGNTIPTSMNQQSPNGFHPGSGVMNNMVRPHQRRPIMHQSLTELLEQPDTLDEAMDSVSMGSSQMGQPQPQMGQMQMGQQQNPPPTVVSQSNQSSPFMNSTVNNTNVQNSRNILGGLNVTNLTPQQRNMLTTSLLRQVLTTDMNNSAPNMQNNKQAFLSQQQNGLSTGQASTHLMSGGSMQSQSSYPSTTGVPRQGSELEFLTDIIPGDFSDCPDVDQLINHELTFDNNLDFNFLEGSVAHQQQLQQLQQLQQQQQQQQQQGGSGGESAQSATCL